MAAATIIPLEHYRSTGDVAVAEAAYPAAKALVEFYRRHGNPLINFGAENDWLAIEACTPDARRKWALRVNQCIDGGVRFTENLLENTDGVPRPPPKAVECRTTPSVFPRGGTLPATFYLC